jgi:hypothetical protein
MKILKIIKYFIDSLTSYCKFSKRIWELQPKYTAILGILSSLIGMYELLQWIIDYSCFFYIFGYFIEFINGSTNDHIITSSKLDIKKCEMHRSMKSIFRC